MGQTMPIGFPRQFDPAWHAFPVRILALDPSLRATGYAILEGTAEKPAVLTSGTIKNPASRTSQDCLIEIHDRLSELISQHSPTAPDEASRFYTDALFCAVGNPILLSSRSNSAPSTLFIKSMSSSNHFATL